MTRDHLAANKLDHLNQQSIIQQQQSETMTMTMHVQSAVASNSPNGNKAIHVLTHAAAKMRMFNAVTEWDRKQSTKKGYNVFALGHYARALEGIDEMIEDGKLSLREAIVRSFCGQLQAVVLKSVGQLPAEKSEQPKMNWR